MRRSAPVIALVKIGAAAALTSAALAESWDPTTLGGIRIVLIVMFALLGTIFTFAPNCEQRAQYLGIVLLLVSSVFADPYLALAQGSQVAGSGLVLTLAAVEVDAFLAYFTWLFVRDFPRVADHLSGSRPARMITTFSLVGGIILLAANLAALIPSTSTSWSALLWALSRRNIASLYWPMIYVPCALAIVYMLWRTRLASRDERRRVNVAVWGIAAGAGPMVLWTIGTSVSSAFALGFPLSDAGWIIFPALLLCPVAVGYAVIVDKALDVRLIVRGAIQYAMARYSLIAAASAPVALIVVHAYRNRADSTDAVLFTERTAWLAGLSLLMTMVLRSRRGILDRIDRAFFRKEYDAQQVMQLLVDNCRWAGTPDELAAILCVEIDTALHPTRVDLLFLDSAGGRYVSPLARLRPLSSDSGIIGRLHRAEQSVDLTLERQASVARTFTADDQHWLADSDCRFLLPLRDATHALIGFIALGEKRSELPYTRGDWALLSAAAASAEMATIYHARAALAPPANEAPSDETGALECSACGLILETADPGCTRCGAGCRPATLPRVLVGKYRLEERIGVGGMGVVYRATDLQLDRVIAIKTLPYASPDGAVRMRREARAMARVSHPNLAQIFGAESWKGYPLLLVEYFSGGTLADRLARGALTVTETIDIGCALSAALGALHAAGMLHRDIKPSNIGFSGSGTPKLLDFGIAGVEQHPSGLASGESVSDPPDATGARGTLLYMSPESLRGEPPSLAQDLWALALTLYEAVTGLNPMLGDSYPETRSKIAAGQLPHTRQPTAQLPRDVAAFFNRALSVRADERPRTAHVFHSELITLSGRRHLTIEAASRDAA